jgi:hypothetical protein
VNLKKFEEEFGAETDRVFNTTVFYRERCRTCHLGVGQMLKGKEYENARLNDSERQEAGERNLQ